MQPGEIGDDDDGAAGDSGHEDSGKSGKRRVNNLLQCPKQSQDNESPASRMTIKLTVMVVMVEHALALIKSTVGMNMSQKYCGLSSLK